MPIRLIRAPNIHPPRRVPRSGRRRSIILQREMIAIIDIRAQAARMPARPRRRNALIACATGHRERRDWGCRSEFLGAPEGPGSGGFGVEIGGGAGSVTVTAGGAVGGPETRVTAVVVAVARVAATGAAADAEEPEES